MNDPEAVPSPLSPTASGAEVLAEARLNQQMPATSTDIQAPADGSIPGEFATATSAGEAWCAGASEWADSPQGAGLGGFSLDSPAAADDWPTGMSFSHQGP